MKKLTAVALTLAGSLVATAALADAPGAGPAKFGTANSIVISANALNILSYASTKPDSGDSATDMKLGGFTDLAGIGADWFVAENISIGGGLQYRTSKVVDTATEISFLPRLGYVMDMGPNALWLQAGLAYTSSDPGGGADKSSKMGVQVGGSYLYFIGGSRVFIGPQAYLSLDLSNKTGDNNGPKTTALGVQGLLGTYF